MAKKAKKCEISKNVIISILVVIIVLLAMGIIFISFDSGEKIINGFSESECKILKNNDMDWLNENCKCIEWKGERSCLPGMELKNETCVNATSYSRTFIACSKYKCPERDIDLK